MREVGKRKWAEMTQHFPQLGSLDNGEHTDLKGKLEQKLLLGKNGQLILN